MLGVLQFMGLERVRQDVAIEQQQQNVEKTQKGILESSDTLL